MSAAPRASRPEAAGFLRAGRDPASDVGGGYPESQLLDVALQWMVCEAVCLDEGLRIRPRHGVMLAPDARGPLHDPRARGLARLDVLEQGSDLLIMPGDRACQIFVGRQSLAQAYKCTHDRHIHLHRLL